MGRLPAVVAGELGAVTARCTTHHFEASTLIVFGVVGVVVGVGRAGTGV